MRFPIASLLLIISGFIFFVFWAVSSYLIDATYNAMSPLGSGLDASYASELSLLPTAFGVICAIFFVTGIVSVFLLDSLSDEPEYYYKQY